MEQRLFDADSLIDAVANAVMQAVGDEILADLSPSPAACASPSDHDAEMSSVQSRNLGAVNRFAEDVAVRVVAEVVDHSDYETNLLLDLAAQEVQELSNGHEHSFGKANASPSWRRSPLRSRKDLSNTVITAWPTFDKALARVAQVAVKDRIKEIATPIASGVAASVTTATGNPVAGAVVGSVLSLTASVVAEIMAQIATIATATEYVDPAMQCVYQRAMRMARLNPHMQVSVSKVAQSFSRVGSSGEYVCSSPYLEGVIKCPFRSTVTVGDDNGKGPVRCLLTDVSGRPKAWRDNEGLEDKIRRMMRKLESQKVLSSRIDRHPDTFFRPKRLVTGLDGMGGR